MSVGDAAAEWDVLVELSEERAAEARRQAELRKGR